MRKTNRASLAMYYYDFREDQKMDLRGLLSSVLFQLCDKSYAYYNILSSFQLMYRYGNPSPSDGDLIRCLTSLFNVPGTLPVYLIIDGLDECPSTSSLSSPREQVLTLLEDLVEAKFSNLRICVTSRPEDDIRTCLEHLAFRSISLHDERGQKEDIKKYIESVINTNRDMKNWSLEQKQLVTNTLIERSDGM
jgi:NACHT domain